MKRYDRIKALAEDISTILLYMPKMDPRSTAQVEAEAVRIAKRLRHEFDVYGGAGEFALKEATKIINRRKHGKLR